MAAAAAAAAAPMTLAPRCGFCNSQCNLLRCGSCKVMSYCSREHQISHREAHKRFCSQAKKARTHLDAEEKKLLEEAGNDFDMPPYPFENEVGHFWGIWGTRDYMRARYAYVESILKIDTFHAVQAAYDHLRDMLRLCRGDNMGVRDQIPALLLRLRRDQDCYDFVKWWFVVDKDSHYNWADTDLPYLDIVGADIFEPVTNLSSTWNFASLGHTTAITLLKIRLLLDVKDLRNIEELGRKMPRELVDYAKDFLPRTSVVSDDRDIMLSTGHGALVEKLEGQVDELFKAVEGLNKHFWPAVLRPGNHLHAGLSAYSHGSVAEMRLVLQYSYAAWLETPGAIDFIKAKVEAA